MGHLITVAACSLNQWALDFEGNTKRIIESIKKAKEAGAKFRVGPELEVGIYIPIVSQIAKPVVMLISSPYFSSIQICGYGCLDHLLEQDPPVHCWGMLERILKDEECYNILLDIGMPVQHRNVRYNCRIVCLNGKILLIRPKMWLANDGDYRCDGDRLYYDGCAMILVNGEVVAQGSQFSLNDVEVVTATVDLEEVRAYRSTISRGFQAAMSEMKYDRILTDFELGPEKDDLDVDRRPSPAIQPRYHSPEEENALCTGAFLWDYLRWCGAAGYLVPLSGGIDSCATVTAVFSMRRLVIEACEAGNEQVIADVKRLAKYTEGNIPKAPQDLCNQLLHTIYMGMSKQSFKETRSRAKDLLNALNSYHINLDIDDVYEHSRISLLAR
ncbi:MAG: glutamine-dependent NAD(+) synthetase [Geoglossum umbratile]|nr:MAG: glutamine-dependent NAD(+) synthetase [Geoglossum umbratile]